MKNNFVNTCFKTKKPTSTDTGPDPLCRNNSSLDAIIQGQADTIYVFKGAQYWQC